MVGGDFHWQAPPGAWTLEFHVRPALGVHRPRSLTVGPHAEEAREPPEIWLDVWRVAMHTLKTKAI